MYGTMARVRLKPGQEQALEEIGRSWLEERAPQVDGFIADYILAPDGRPDERLMLVVFDSRESYLKNARDPEQDRWYRRMREALTADPQWTDGEIVALAPVTVSR
jgi:heme-degrading monooxygenase HmoA